MKRQVLQLPVTAISVALLLAALSLTPSLLPREVWVQGILTGCVMGVGYFLGKAISWTLRFLGLRIENKSALSAIKLISLCVSAFLFALCLWLWSGWQQTYRAPLNLPELHRTTPLYILIIAMPVVMVFVGLGESIRLSIQIAARRVFGFVPYRAAMLLSILFVGFCGSFLFNGLVLRNILNVADKFYADLDALAGQFEDMPEDPLKSGSAASLIDWDTIGRDSRVYVQSGPTANAISHVSGQPAVDPIRVYVGLRSASTVEERAELALAELKRVNAFDRPLLVIIMPVGTGWIDPLSVDTLEILHRGNVASVAMQYSYLTSWLSLIVEPEVGVSASRALFKTIYDYWKTLPEDDRPELYLHGLSLGSYASQKAFSVIDILGAPVAGALWVGSPFSSDLWSGIVRDRNPESTPWLPIVGDGSIVRSANQFHKFDDVAGVWGPVKFGFLQYASDPIVFFNPRLWFVRPEWLGSVRERDVSKALNWSPIVTFFQIAMDMAIAQTAPIGYGHVYSAQDYLYAWASITSKQLPENSDLELLAKRLEIKGTVSSIKPGWFLH